MAVQNLPPTLQQALRESQTGRGTVGGARLAQMAGELSRGGRRQCRSGVDANILLELLQVRTGEVPSLEALCAQSLRAARIQPRGEHNELKVALEVLYTPAEGRVPHVQRVVTVAPGLTSDGGLSVIKNGFAQVLQSAAGVYHHVDTVFDLHAVFQKDCEPPGSAVLTHVQCSCGFLVDCRFSPPDDGRPDASVGTPCDIALDARFATEWHAILELLQTEECAFPPGQVDEGCNHCAGSGATRSGLAVKHETGPLGLLLERRVDSVELHGPRGHPVRHGQPDVLHVLATGQEAAIHFPWRQHIATDGGDVVFVGHARLPPVQLLPDVDVHAVPGRTLELPRDEDASLVGRNFRDYVLFQAGLHTLDPLRGDVGVLLEIFIGTQLFT